MKLWYLPVFLLYIAVAVAPAAQAPAPRNLSPFEQTLIAAENSFISAAKKGDPEFLKRTLADDYDSISFDGQEYGRQEVIDQLSFGGVELQAYNMKVVPAGENSAIVTYDVILHVPEVEDQGPPPRYQHWSSVWVKQGDQWKLKFQQATATHWGDW